MRETCWRCRPVFSPATGPRRSAAGLLSEPPDVGLSCSSVLLAWGSSCRAWRWTLEDHTQADMLRLHGNAGRCFCVNENEHTNLLLLKRLLNLLQIGEQADVCADLQANQKPCAQT